MTESDMPPREIEHRIAALNRVLRDRTVMEHELTDLQVLRHGAPSGRPPSPRFARLWRDATMLGVEP